MKKIKDARLFEAIKTFLTEYLPNVRALSPHTVQAYKDALNLYLLFLKEVGHKELSQILSSDFSAENLLRFLQWLETERKCAGSTRNQRLAAIRAFCKYLFNNASDFVEYSKISEIKPAKTVDKVLCEVLTIEQVKTLLSIPDVTTDFGLRDYFYMALLYDTGCRNDEVLSLSRGDFVIHKDGSSEVKVIGKGRKFRITPVSKDVTANYKQYILRFHARRDINTPLFYIRHGSAITQMSPDNAARILNKYEKIYRERNPEIPHLHPHLFRHTRAMHLYQAGMPLPLIGEWLGHSHLETTLIYAYADTGMKRSAVDKVTNANNTVFSNEEFIYKNDEEVIRKLYGLE